MIKRIKKVVIVKKIKKIKGEIGNEKDKINNRNDNRSHTNDNANTHFSYYASLVSTFGVHCIWDNWLKKKCKRKE